MNCARFWCSYSLSVIEQIVGAATFFGSFTGVGRRVLHGHGLGKDGDGRKWKRLDGGGLALASGPPFDTTTSAITPLAGRRSVVNSSHQTRKNKDQRQINALSFHFLSVFSFHWFSTSSFNMSLLFPILRSFMNLIFFVGGWGGGGVTHVIPGRRDGLNIVVMSSIL